MFSTAVTHLRRQYAGFLALFIVLGGTSYAVASGSIGSREVKDNSLRSKDIRNGELGGADIKNGALGPRDLSRSVLGGFQGPPGLPGPQGAAGLRGVQGPPGVSGLELVSADSELNSDSPKGLSASCPAGKRLLGSGARALGGKTGDSPNELTNVVIERIVPGLSLTGVIVTAVEEEPTASPWQVTAYAICANVS